MKIKKLETTGFKSFVDRTVIRFDHQITCVVGPNGCGKSNVVDAIKWVMGEQSPQRLRGKSMEDVIFSGAEGRAPAGFAEVILTFDNSDGVAPPEYSDYAEISVARRLDREGHSDYFINKTPVRLMDVTNLFLGTGVGRRAYSIIEQGRIGFIVSSKPEDRRHMIEEAAGVTKFKARKRAAERKMEHTRQNLLRVTDIINELERTLASLKRQSQKAERYKRYRDEARGLELYVASHRYLELHAESEIVGREFNTAQEESQDLRASLNAQDAEVETKRSDLQRLASEVERHQAQAYEADNRVRYLESLIQQHRDGIESLKQRVASAQREIEETSEQGSELRQESAQIEQALEDLESVEAEAASLLERADAELARRKLAAEESETAASNARARVADAQARIARAEAVVASFSDRRSEVHEQGDRLHIERGALDTRVVDLKQERSELEARLNVLKQGQASHSEKEEQAKSDLESRRQQISQYDRSVEELREELARTSSRLRSLEEIQARFEGAGAGVQALMTRYAATQGERFAKGIRGLVADRIDCGSELASALAAALGQYSQAIVVERLEAGQKAISFLRAQDRGRITTIPAAPLGVRALVAPPVATGVRGRLLDLVSFDAVDREWIAHLLGDVVLVETLVDAVSLQRSGWRSGRLVTLGGELITPAGVVTGGAEDDAVAHLLEMKHEARGLKVSEEGLRAELDAALAEKGSLRAQIAEHQAAIDTVRVEAHQAQISLIGAEKDLNNHDVELNRVQERIAAIDKEQLRLRELIRTTDLEESDAKREIEQAKSAHDEAVQQLAAADAVLIERKAAVEAQTSEVTEVRVRATQAQERAERDRSNLARIRRTLEEIASREQRLRMEGQEAQEEIARSEGRMLLQGGRLSESVELAIEVKDRVRKGKEVYEAASHALSQIEAELKHLRSELEGKVQSVNELTLRQRELVLATEHLVEQIEERHQRDLLSAVSDYHDRPVPDASVKERIEELQRLINRMGEINLTAISEYAENSERYEHLTTQRADLESALGQLERAIRQMNRESKALFREAFAGINERFKRVFPLLFQGGKAELILTEPTDLLESGVDIAAQPPGKRIGSLELMSGGEKALTAVALIFSIFQYKPSPFCLLDEVDAPLDEANIARFAESVQQMTDRSQFIVITHSKRTMEYADVLYGVTMEQPGISNLVAVELTNKGKTGDKDRSAAA